MDATALAKSIGKSFPALSHRNYRLFFFGQCVSLIGTWMQNIGQAWLVLELTGSPVKLGIVSALQFLPVTLFSLFAGTLADRLPKRRVLLFTQSALAVLAAVLAVLAYFRVVQYWHVLVLALLLGIVNTLDIPTRLAFIVDLVGHGDLMNAIGLNSSIFNLARILGPAVAGFLIVLVGIPVCFAINAASFLAVIVALAAMRLPPCPPVRDVAQPLRNTVADIKDGLSYIRSIPRILYPLVLLAILSAFVMNYGVLVPVFARKALSLDASGYGFLMTSIGIGSFVAALSVATRGRRWPKLPVLFAGAAGMSGLLFALGFQRNFVLVSVTLAAIGFCAILFTTLVNTTIQLATEDAMRGRVMSVFTMVFGGASPIGSLYAGSLIESVGVYGCLFASGAIGIAGTLIVLWLLRGELKQPVAA